MLGFLATVFFPMHRREVLAGGGATISDELHKYCTIVGTLFMLAAMISGAMLFAAFGDVPRMTANLPTPGQGVKERANAFGYMACRAAGGHALVRAPPATRRWRFVGEIRAAVCPTLKGVRW